MVESESSVDVSVRTIEIVYPDGEVRRLLKVFCPVERVSLNPKLCERCDHCAAMPPCLEAEGASLRCVAAPAEIISPRRPWFVGPDAAAGSVPVGAVIGRIVVSAHRTTPSRLVCDVLDRHAVRAALVIDDDRNVVGAVLRADIADHDGIVADAMASGTPCVRESAPLSAAIAPMAYRRARVVAIVRDDGRFIGLVTELDVLRWIARGGAL